jgi:hypothetical protein
VIENVLPEVGNEQIVPTVVVIVADTASLTPAGVGNSGFESYIRERAIAIIAKKVRCWLLASGKTLEAHSVDQEDVQPAIVVVIVESDTAAGGFEQIFVLMLATKDRLGVEARFSSNIQETDTQVCRLLAHTPE